jgi:HEAT repeat protein
MQWSSHSSPKRPHRFHYVGAIAVVFGPVLLLAWEGLATNNLHNSILAVVLVEALVLSWLILQWGLIRTATSPWILIPYLATGLLQRFVFFDPSNSGDQFRVAVTILALVGLVSLGEIRNHSGNVRRAKFLLKKLLAREQWPAYEDFHALPEVQALRTALYDNAAPALPFLAHPDPRVQVAILTALAFQSHWRKTQPEIVLHYTAGSDEPVVRAAAALALARLKKTRHLNVLLTFMHDPYTIVRRAAAQAIMWDATHRWTIIRAQIRVALADPNAAKDGPLPTSSGLPASALQDLLMWSGEAGPVGKRSTATLIRYCKKLINEEATSESIQRVLDLVANPKVASSIRVELAHQLSLAEAFAPEVAAKLIDPGHPTLLRLMAAGALLAQREDPRAVEVLRQAARQPNREIALASAAIIQKYLGVDIGLAVGGELPPSNSRQAAEVTRRVMEWANNEVIPSSFDGPVDGVAIIVNQD